MTPTQDQIDRLQMLGTNLQTAVTALEAVQDMLDDEEHPLPVEPFFGGVLFTYLVVGTSAVSEALELLANLTGTALVEKAEAEMEATRVKHRAQIQAILTGQAFGAKGNPIPPVAEDDVNPELQEVAAGVTGPVGPSGCPGDCGECDE